MQGNFILTGGILLLSQNGDNFLTLFANILGSQEIDRKNFVRFVQESVFSFSFLSHLPAGI